MTWLSRIGAATALCCAAPPARALAQTPAQTSAPVIDTIIVQNGNVFNPADQSLGVLARLANALHVTTHAGIIRRSLLINPGDRYDSARVVESERALRRLNVFSRVRIDTSSVAGRLALRVRTTDGWSTKPQLGYSTAGGSTTWLAGVVEDNLLGTATSLTAVYNHTPDRGILDIAYVSPHFFGRRTRLAAEYAVKSDGRTRVWQLGLPFYETAAPRALTTDGNAASERVLIYKDGGLDTTLEHRELRFGVTAGLAPRATSRDYLRLWASGQWRREGYAPEPPIALVVPQSVFGAAGAGLDVGHVRFQVLERFNSYARREYIDVSQLAHLGVWAAPRAWGYGAGQAGVGVEASAQLAARWRDGFAALRGAGNGVFTAGRPDSGRVSGAVTVASQGLRRQTLILHLEGARLRRPPTGYQFDLWTTRNGPRVFAIHEFTGTRMAWLALEDRVLVADEVWGLLGIGVAPFCDYGGAWYPTEAARLGGDVGLSLRLGPTRAGGGEVAEFAVGYRFGAGFAGSRWGLAIRKGLVYY